MRNFNDFLKTRAGFAYVRECVKCGLCIYEAAVGRPDVYEVQATNRYGISGVTHTTYVCESIRMLYWQGIDALTIRKYVPMERKYVVVYNGSCKALYNWMSFGWVWAHVALYRYSRLVDEQPSVIYTARECPGFNHENVPITTTDDHGILLYYAFVELAQEPGCRIVGFAKGIRHCNVMFEADAAFLRDTHRWQPCHLNDDSDLPF